MKKHLLSKQVQALLTAIVIDDVGQPKHNRKQEIVFQQGCFSGFCTPVPLNVYTPNSAHPSKFKTGTDLVIYDFGCVGDSSSGNARYLIQWAQDNLNSLIVIVSKNTFTKFIEPEMRQLGLLDDGMYNITFFKPKSDPIPDWFKLAHGIKGLQQYG